jgi:hypothetical protein
MRRTALILAVFCSSYASLAETSESAGAAALARIRGLAGEWEGPFEWTGARTGTGTMHVSYSLTGYGSAVVENLSSGGDPSMTTVYHLDGADLRMTHFCGTQNQPRLKASRIDLTQGAVDFSFVDITNLKSPDAPHVYGAELRFIDADHMTLTFRFQSGAQKSRERIVLKRLSSKAPQTGG